MLLQTCMNFIILLNTKADIFVNKQLLGTIDWTIYYYPIYVA